MCTDITFEKEDLERIKEVGFEPDGEKSGSFLQENHSVSLCTAIQEGLEILPIEESLKKYSWLREIYWSLVDPKKDRFTEEVFKNQKGGYFIRALPGAKIKIPVQSCLYIKDEGLTQRVHNVVIAEENSEIVVVTGCTSHKNVKEAVHIGISEFFVRKNAKLVFSMIHSWGENVVVRPRTGVLVEEGGVFISNYVCMEKTKSVQMYPTCYLKGKGAKANLSSIILAKPGSDLDIGGRVVFQAPETSADIISRTVTSGGRVVARGHMLAEVEGCKGHLECRALMIGEKGHIHAIPELEAKVRDVELSHEAAVGKIAKEELEYLMARGLTEEEAVSLIVKGFLTVEIEGLPNYLKKRIDLLIEKTRQDMF